MENIKIFLKGILMGICDLIPGISGGTIAFITGIYIRFITAINNLFTYIGKDIVRYLTLREKITTKKIKHDAQRLDLVFLATLFSGILIAVFLGSQTIKFILDDYFVCAISFFIGLILASSKIIYDKIEKHNLRNSIFAFIGFLAGVAASYIIPLSVTPNLPYVFVGGFFAISAMFLPGISGAFVLLIMGLYEFLIDALNDIWGHLHYLVIFLLGAVTGAVVISRFITFLFEKDKCKTLYFLLGLVLGALSIPVNNILNTVPVWTFEQTIYVIFFVLLGLVIVFGLLWIEKRKSKKS